MLDLWRKIAVVQHGIFNVETDRLLLDECCFLPAVRSNPAALVKVKLRSCMNYNQAAAVRRETEWLGQSYGRVMISNQARTAAVSEVSSYVAVPSRFSPANIRITDENLTFLVKKPLQNMWPTTKLRV